MLTLNALRVGIAALSSAASTEHWLLSGDTDSFGIKQHYTLDFQGARFFTNFEGDLPLRFSFDGADAVVDGVARVPHKANYFLRDYSLIVPWVISGEWSEKDTPITVDHKPDGSLALTPVNGKLTANLTLSADKLPQKLTYWTPGGDETWDFGGYKSFGTRTFPTVIKHSYASQTAEIHIRTAEQVDKSIDTSWPAPDPQTTFGDLSQPVEFKRNANLIFVHPLLNGKDVGWFILDSGSDVMCLDPTIAKSLGLPVVGKDVTAGAVGLMENKFYRGDKFELGGLSFPKPTFTEFDLSGIGQAVGLKLAGICGYDFVSRGILDIHFAESKLWIHKPTEDLAANWTPIEFDENRASIICTWEGDHSGLFDLDTGSPFNVDFTSPTVSRYHMLDGKATGESVLAGAGGAHSFKTGTIKWIQVGGRRMENLQVGFHSTTVGVFASPYMDGNIGNGIMAKFNLILDFPHQRVAFQDPKAK